MEKNEWLIQLFEFINSDKEYGVNARTLDYANELINQLSKIPNVELDEKDLHILEQILMIADQEYVLLWLSVLAEYTKCERIFYELTQYALSKRKLFSIETQFYIYSQLRAKAFGNSYSLDQYCNPNFDSWLFEIVSYYRNLFRDFLTPIEPNQRNRNLVFVVSDQVLGNNHSPTAFALSWCKYLVKQGKNVLLINTAEMLSSRGKIPFVGATANYVDSYSELSFFEYEDIKIPFFQCPKVMPDAEILQILLNTIHEVKPGYILSISDNIFSDLADKIVPVYSLSTSADMPRRHTKYRSLYRNLTDYEKHWMEIYGYNNNSLINTCFSFNLPVQKNHYSREEYGIPQDAFCMAVVGNRLDQELDDDFIKILLKVLENEKNYIFFIGKFDYEKMVNDNQMFKKKTTWLSYADDLLAVLELCDLYVNPKRLGGGTSAVFAMSLGKPVITLNYGDVSLNSGESFCVDDFEGMINSINKYIQDYAYYEAMSNLAKKRAKEVTDVNAIMRMQIKEIEQKEGLEG